MSDDQTPANEFETPQAARFTGETLLGCLGLACVLLTLPLLWLAVGVGAGWAARVLPLLAFAAALGGVALIARVPASHAARSSDPARPLTHAGAAPAIERPAQSAHRLAWALTAALCLCALVGYALEVTQAGSAPGLALMLCAGVLLLGQGLLVALGVAPPPAWRWLRLSIYGGATRQSLTLVAIGGVTLAAALFLALVDGHLWGAGGLGLLVVALALVAPLARRAPIPRNLPRARNENAPPRD